MAATRPEWLVMQEERAASLDAAPVGKPHEAEVEDSGRYCVLPRVHRQPVQCELESAGGEWVVTESGSKICHLGSLICGLEQARLGRSNVLASGVALRADLASIKTGDFVVVSPGVLLHPCFKGASKTRARKFQRLSIGSHVFIGDRTIVQAAEIGSHVVIGEDVIISPRVQVKGCVWVQDGALVLPDQVLPPYTVWAGDPARCVGQLPESAQSDAQQLCEFEWARYVFSS
eukprot:Hpha_TRINITY_DN15571_c2_g10::TRINITY_DN15571_c2_g10_i1::g.106265::m.106265/K10427/DCTN5; dynactin 5